MKKSNKRLAWTAVVVVIATIFMWFGPTVLYSCANARNDQQQVSVDNGEPVENTDTDAANTANSNTPAADGENVIPPKGYVSQEDYDQVCDQLNSSNQDNEALNGENVKLKGDIQTAVSENAKAQKEIATQSARADVAQKLADALQTKLNNVHPITVKNGKVWVHIDDFLNAANGVGAIIKNERGYAMRATSGTHVVIYDDMSWDRSFLVENFDLPMTQAYSIALTRDEGKTAFVASFGNYSWANGGLFTDYRSVEFARELTSMPKNGKSGEQFFALLSACAIVAQDENGEYRFAIYAGDFEANPTPAPQPTVGPEVIVKEITNTVTEQVFIDRCGRCGELIENCICKPEIIETTKTETVVIEKVKVIEKTVEPEKPDEPDEPDEPEKPNKPDHNPRPDDSNTDHNPRPWDNDDNITGDDYDDSDITGNDYDDDTAHNPREDDSDITGGVHDPFNDDGDITGGVHDPEYNGDSNSTDHSPREEESITSNSVDNAIDNINPNFDDVDITGSDHDITGDSSSHSPREEDNITSDSVVDNEIDDITSTHVGNDTDNITSNFDDVDITGSTANNSGTGHSERP